RRPVLRNRGHGLAHAAAAVPSDQPSHGRRPPPAALQGGLAAADRRVADQPRRLLGVEHPGQLPDQRPDDRDRGHCRPLQVPEEAPPSMSALPDERPPRLGLRLLTRGLLAMLLISLLSAASVATAVLLEVKKDAD